MQCLDLSNAVVNSLYAILFRTDRLPFLFSNRLLTRIRWTSSYMQAGFYRLSPYLVFGFVLHHHRDALLYLQPSLTQIFSYDAWSPTILSMGPRGFPDMKNVAVHRHCRRVSNTANASYGYCVSLLIILMTHNKKSLSSRYSIFVGRLQKIHFYKFVIHITLVILTSCKSGLRCYILHYSPCSINPIFVITCLIYY